MIQSLWIKDYRNLKETTLRLKPKESVFVLGKNNQGKTNFLESLYWLGNSSSPFKTAVPEVVSLSKPEGFLGADVSLSDDGANRIYHKLTQDGKRVVEVNGKRLKSFKEISTFVWTEFLSADVIRLFQDRPEGRRSFLDRFCSFFYKEYAMLLSKYDKALKQKNKALKQDASVDDIRLWNQQLILLAPQIVSCRLEVLSLLEAQLSGILSEVLPQFSESVTVRYDLTRLTCPLTHLPDYQQALRDKLEEDAQKERFLGYSLVGPQRDDLSIFLNEKPLVSAYSRGINRLVSIGLYVSMYWILAQHRGHYPVLLLDDAFAEVDPDNKRHIISYLMERTQLFYTSVLAEDKALFSTGQSFTMEDGVLHHG